MPTKASAMPISKKIYKTSNSMMLVDEKTSDRLRFVTVQFDSQRKVFVGGANESIQALGQKCQNARSQ
jgi:hypothetical protein